MYRRDGMGRGEWDDGDNEVDENDIIIWSWDILKRVCMCVCVKKVFGPYLEWDFVYYPAQTQTRSDGCHFPIVCFKTAFLPISVNEFDSNNQAAHRSIFWRSPLLNNEDLIVPMMSSNKQLDSNFTIDCGGGCNDKNMIEKNVSMPAKPRTT